MQEEWNRIMNGGEGMGARNTSRERGERDEWTNGRIAHSTQATQNRNREERRIWDWNGRGRIE